MVLYLSIFGAFAWVLFIVVMADRFFPDHAVATPTAEDPGPDRRASATDDAKRSFTVPSGISTDWFQGKWERKFWMNLPGPFYSTVDNILTSPVAYDVPTYIMEGGMDGEEYHFFWRQPEFEFEVKRCLEAMSNDDTASYQIDGNARWTPDLVREWWRREKDRLIEWAELELEKVLSERGTQRYSATREGYLHVYIRFMKQDAETYLRKYIYFLGTGALPQAGEALSEL